MFAFIKKIFIGLLASYDLSHNYHKTIRTFS